MQMVNTVFGFGHIVPNKARDATNRTLVFFDNPPEEWKFLHQAQGGLWIDFFDMKIIETLVQR